MQSSFALRMRVSLPFRVDLFQIEFRSGSSLNSRVASINFEIFNETTLEGDCGAHPTLLPSKYLIIWLKISAWAFLTP